MRINLKSKNNLKANIAIKAPETHLVVHPVLTHLGILVEISKAAIFLSSLSRCLVLREVDKVVGKQNIKDTIIKPN
ncbi:hypothetical protein D3C80_1781070 [compost metagenome]